MSSSVVAKRIGPPEPAEDRAPASTIQHISPVVLDTLRELSVPVRQRYRDLFDEYWGRPCGRRINDVLYCATSVDSDDLKLLYVRQDYARAWTALQGRLAAGLSKGVVWEGQPGIGSSSKTPTSLPVTDCPSPFTGKSLGLRYLLLRSFETCSPVIYCPNPNKDVYIFCNQGVFQIPQNAWDHFKYLITPIFLLDSPPKNTDIPMDLYNGAPYPICLATSPQWSRYHEFKKQTKADFLVLDLVHKSELREFMYVIYSARFELNSLTRRARIATVDLEEKRGDPHVVRLDDDHSLSDPIVNNDLDDPKHSSPSLSIKTSKPSTRLTPASSAASEAPDPSSSAAVSDNSTPHRQPEADDSGDSDSETTTPASSFIPLPDYVEKYWADWASTNKFWHPIDVFRLAGPSFRAPFFGHARATSDFCLDYIGGPVHTVPVTALSELYRVMANCRSSTSSGGADPNTFLQLRPEAQASHFHLFFFEEPLTKELSSGVIPPSQYILPTDWLCEIVIAAIAEVEADVAKGLLPLFKSNQHLYGVYFKA